MSDAAIILCAFIVGLCAAACPPLAWAGAALLGAYLAVFD